MKYFKNKLVIISTVQYEELVYYYVYYVLLHNLMVYKVEKQSSYNNIFHQQIILINSYLEIDAITVRDVEKIFNDTWTQFLPFYNRSNYSTLPYTTYTQTFTVGGVSAASVPWQLPNILCKTRVTKPETQSQYMINTKNREAILLSCCSFPFMFKLGKGRKELM